MPVSSPRYFVQNLNSLRIDYSTISVLGLYQLALKELGLTADYRGQISKKNQIAAVLIPVRREMDLSDCEHQSSSIGKEALTKLQTQMLPSSMTSFVHSLKIPFANGPHGKRSILHELSPYFHARHLFGASHGKTPGSRPDWETKIP